MRARSVCSVRSKVSLQSKLWRGFVWPDNYEAAERTTLTAVVTTTGSSAR